MNRVHLLLLGFLVAGSGCSVHRTLVRLAASAMTSSGGTLAEDDDPELVRDAAPFGLKTMEGLLADDPENVRLLTALASGFTQYAYAFVQQDADREELEGKNALAMATKLRAKKLYLRARDYGLRGLEVKHPGFSKDVDSGVIRAKEEDVPLLYWTAASWALAIGDAKDDMALVGDLGHVAALAKRALELDESWNEGDLHAFFVSFSAALRPDQGGGGAAAKLHLDRAMALSHNKKLGPLVSFAEGPCVQSQNKAEFEKLLKEVESFDVDSDKKDRLANTIAQRRAKLLLAHEGDLFL